MTFGERLRELREECGVTQKKIATVLNVSPRMVSFYESGEHFPRDAEQLLLLAAFFNTSADYLLGRSSVRYSSQQQRMLAAYEKLQFSDQKSVIDYMEFLATRNATKATKESTSVSHTPSNPQNK